MLRDLTIYCNFSFPKIAIAIETSGTKNRNKSVKKFEKIFLLKIVLNKYLVHA